MDITLQVIVAENPNTPESAGKWKQGDIVQVYPSSKVTEDPHPGSRMGFIQIADAPYDTIEQAREALVVADIDENEQYLSKSKRRVAVPSLPPQAAKVARAYAAVQFEDK